ncbi:hypothetical protein SAY86_010027 [Trapa natans]|uniref:Transmembrane protein n=1 Tax=Trapa natans TaxID=22666 RepID=A0AAN7KX19_TRANT|nr:hypothetical protein SAY86_010027 [Trapa natans]
MDNQTILKKDKLGLPGILRQSLSIAGKNPKLLLFSLLTSFPLFLSLLIFEFLFHETLLNSVDTLLSDDAPHATYCNGNICSFTISSYSRWNQPFSSTRVIAEHYHRFVLLGLVYLMLVHTLDLLNTILILCHSSALYAGDTLQSVKAFFLRPIKDFSFKGPLITSLYALGLSTLVTVGLISLGSHVWMYGPWPGFPFFMGYDFYSFRRWDEFIAAFVLMLLFGGAFLALLIKYIEWSSVWKVGIVISVLEEKHGHIAIGVAAYISRECRRRGFLLMLPFFLWRLGLRFICLYLTWANNWGRSVMIAQVLGVCLSNLLMWVVLLVYHCDCKRRLLEKKMDVEGGGKPVLHQ